MIYKCVIKVNDDFLVYGENLVGIWEVCIEKNIIVPPPLTLSENIIISIIFMLVVYSMIHISCCSDEETREWTRGYIFGRLMEMLFSIIIDIFIGDKD